MTWNLAEIDDTIANLQAELDRLRAERAAMRTQRIADLRAELAALEADAAGGAEEPANPLICPHCGYQGKSRRGVSNHIRRMHPDAAPPPPDPTTMQPCPTCGQAYKRLASHYAHAPACDPQRQAAADQTEPAEPEPDPAARPPVQRPAPPGAAGVIADEHWRCAQCHRHDFTASMSDRQRCVRCTGEYRQAA
jgi:uncharacterized small protein (DUF1192 family)